MPGAAVTQADFEIAPGVWTHNETVDSLAAAGSCCQKFVCAIPCPATVSVRDVALRGRPGSVVVSSGPLPAANITFRGSVGAAASGEGYVFFCNCVYHTPLLRSAQVDTSGVAVQYGVPVAVVALSLVALGVVIAYFTIKGDYRVRGPGVGVEIDGRRRLWATRPTCAVC